MEIAYVTGLFTLAGTVFGMLGSLVIANRMVKSQERKHFRELGIKIALTIHRNAVDAAQKEANSTGATRMVPPFPLFLINGIRTMEIVADTKLSAEQVGRRISEFLEFYNDVATELDRQTRGCPKA